MSPPVLVYRETLLAPSEPFITAQGEGLKDHEAWYLSIRRSEGHPIPPARDLRWPTRPVLEPARRYAWKRWGRAPATLRAVRQLRPALVHAHFGRDAAQILPLVERLDLPLVTTFHGHDALRTDESFRTGSWSDRLYIERLPRLASVGARFLAVSTVVRERLVARGLPPARVELHYIGVDVEHIAAHATFDRDPGLVVFAGRLVEHKGASDLLAAVAAVGADMRVILVGDGPDRGELERQAGALGIDATFVGFQAQADVWRWMGRARVVVVPSKTAADGWTEAFGLVAAEAQAAGAAVVASTCGGLTEAVAPANADLAFPEGDVGALADRLHRVLTEPQGGPRAADALAWVREHRNLETQNARLEEIYAEVAR